MVLSLVGFCFHRLVMVEEENFVDLARPDSLMGD